MISSLCEQSIFFVPFAMSTRPVTLGSTGKRVIDIKPTITKFHTVKTHPECWTIIHAFF
jgi:hypothetical protein